MSKKLMKYFPFLLLLFIFCIFPIDVLATETKSEDLAIREYVFLIDTSASMSKGKDVSDQGALYEKLQKTIEKFVEGIQDDLSETGVEIQFYFYTFDEGIAKQADNKVKVFNISSSNTNYKEEIKNYIYSLEFLGHYTHICSSLEEVLEEHEATDHPVIIRLYTDGEENEENPDTREVLYPPWEEFWKKINSLQEGIIWTENENVLIITLGIEWPPPPEPISNLEIITDPEDPTMYHILIQQTELDFGNLYDIGEGVGELTFSMLNKEITLNEFTKKYPNLTVNIVSQGFRPDIIESIEDFTPIKLSSIKDGEYNLTFIVNKNMMIKNKKYGNFSGSFSLKIEEKDIDISIDNYISVLFSFVPEKYRISTSPTELDFGDLYDIAEGKATLAFSVTTDTGLKVNWNQFIEKYSDLIANIVPKGFTSNIIDYIEDFTSIKLRSIKDGEYDLIFSLNKERIMADEKFGDFDGELVFSLNEQSISMTPIPIHFKFYRPEVEVLPVSLNFGSLEAADTVNQKMFFDYNEKALNDKSSFTISIEPSEDNPSSLTIGKNILINNQTNKEVSISAPTPNIDFQISLAQNELNPGNYEGKLVFTSDELFIEGENLISDRKNPEIKYILWKFNISPSPEVKIILLEPGKGKIPINFGLIKEEKQYQQEIMLDFNQQAKGKELKVSLDISPDNPTELVIGKNLWINGQEKKSIDIISATKEIKLVLEVTPSELKYGKYYGRINFTGEELQIKGENLKTDDPTNPNQKYYEWTFKTPMPLWMIILIVAICLIILLIIIYLIWTIKKGGSISLPSLKSSKAVIPDETYLYIRDYDTGKREQINISGKEEVIIGKDGQYLSDTEERIVLRAIKEDGKNMVRLTVESGKVILVKAGSTKEEIVVEQNIFNRDIIKFGNYQIRVSGFYLEKDIN